MKILIVYSSKTGTTKRCAEILADKLNCDTDIVNIKKIKQYDIRGYDKIVIGSNVRMGQIDKQIKQFCVENHQILVEKRAGLFVCCGYPESADHVISTNFNKKLLQRSEAKSCFGGEMDIKKTHGIDKIMLGAVIKVIRKEGRRELPHIMEENIESFAKKIS